MKPKRDQQTIINKKPAPSPTIMKASEILLMPGDDYTGQNIILINRPGPHECFVH